MDWVLASNAKAFFLAMPLPVMMVMNANRCQGKGDRLFERLLPVAILGGGVD